VNLRLGRLFVLMLRFRVAAMIWLFFLLAAAFHTGLEGFRSAYLWSVLALGTSYVAATSANDVADRDIDRVNHPGDRGRPLVSGEATEADLRRLHALAAASAILLAVPAGPGAAALIVLSVGIGRAYSLPPVQLSYRTYLAPAVLGVAYVLIPYALGVVASGADWKASDGALASALFALFTARIVLKDFRDREGDARYGRPTLLLRRGKAVTCRASLAALFAGDALLLVALAPPLWLALAMQVFVIAIVSRLLALDHASRANDEQVAIGLGARMGNGLLVVILAWLVVDGQGADPIRQLFLTALLSGLFLGSFLVLVRRPELAVIRYKG
jgi:4-hydroxybenzoate polyprenyltransferase